MTKYATLKKYQPYIDVIMDDLGLTGKVYINWIFGEWQKMGGDSILYATEFKDGKRYGVVRVDKTVGHMYVLETILHELKHIQQYLNHKLSVAYLKYRTNRRGNLKWEWYTQWYNVEYKFYSTSKNTELNNLYRNQPWEVEAYAYQELAKVKFPNGELPPKRKLVGVVGKTKFYKTAS